MDQVERLLDELKGVRERSGPEACQAVVEALWRLRTTELDALIARFSEAKFHNLAGMCREIRLMRARQN
jgi:hypothetical protein